MLCYWPAISTGQSWTWVGSQNFPSWMVELGRVHCQKYLINMHKELLLEECNFADLLITDFIDIS